DCTLLCDIADQEGVAVPELSPETQRVMVESLDKPTLLGNPLDVEDLQRINAEGFDCCLEKFFQEPKIDMVGGRLSLRETIHAASEKLYQRLCHLRAANDQRVCRLAAALERSA